MLDNRLEGIAPVAYKGLTCDNEVFKLENRKMCVQRDNAQVNVILAKFSNI